MEQEHIALLRGINVGGKNVIKMEELRVAFEKMGFLSVKTYIQSGNVLFKTNLKDRNQIVKIIEENLSDNFTYKAKVILRNKEEIKKTVDHFPLIFKNNSWKHNVIFLSDSIDSKEILNEFKIKEEIENVFYYKGVLYWSALIEKINSSTMMKLSSRNEYQEMTVRNMNTTHKIFSLMCERE